MTTPRNSSESKLPQLASKNRTAQWLSTAVGAAFCFIAALIPLRAQQGDQSDAAGVKQTPRVPLEKIPPAPPLSPERALESFNLQPGFRIELVASEPLVHDPIAIRFDTHGRIWVVEMSGYMPNCDGQGEDQPVGKIVVLQDTNGDGKPDKRTEFLAGLVMPGALSLVAGGVLVGAPPHLWYCQDTNGDLRCDVKTEIATDFSVAGNPQHTPNGLVWALDNWIYTASWPFRIKRLPGGEWVREPTVPRGQYGLSQDDYGRLVYNSNEDPLRIDLISSHYLERNPHYRTTSGLNVDPVNDRTTWPARVNPAVNRGYREGILRDDGTLAHFTAACSPLIYRGKQFPAEFYGNAFICEPAGNLIKRDILWEENGMLHGKQAYTNSEFLASTDERFRPVSLANTPDGALYVVDFYHGLLEHKISLTSYLRRQTEARHLDQPTGLGRIYRIVHEKNPLEVLPAFSNSKPEQWVDVFNHGNGWARETAQRLLVEAHPAETIAALRKMATASPDPVARLDSLWTLEGMGELDDDTVLHNLDFPHSKVRLAAIRLSEPFLRGEEASQFMAHLAAMAGHETSADVRLQLALTLGQTTDPQAEAALLHLAKQPNLDEELSDAILTGLNNRELRFLMSLLKDAAWRSEAKRSVQILNGLGTCIFNSRKTGEIDQLFAIATTAGAPIRRPLLEGMASAAPRIARSVSRGPIRFVSEPKNWRSLNAVTEKEEEARYVAATVKAITWPGQPGYIPPPVVPTLSAGQQRHFDLGQKLYTGTCAGCHQASGQGLSGVAPPLADSEWVLGSERRLTRIVLLGIHGRLNVGGRSFDLEMPSMGKLFDDDQMASVLTYIRREWDNSSNPIETELVKSIRAEVGSRSEAWTEAELKEMK